MKRLDRFGKMVFFFVVIVFVIVFVDFVCFILVFVSINKINRKS